MGIQNDPLADEMAQETAGLTREILERLSEPFPEEAMGWKPQAFNNDKTRALAVPHITARHVMDRLDEVVAPAGWQTDFEFIPGIKAAKVILTVLGITKCDIGFVAGDDDTAIKGSVSDGLKRAAVLFGIGRYLYEVEGQWVDWDNKKRQFSEQPRLKFKNDQAQPPAKPEKAKRAKKAEKHWIEDEKIRKRFWWWAHESLGLTDDEVHEALGVESVKDYMGTMKEAKAAIEQWLAARIDEEATE